MAIAWTDAITTNTTALKSAAPRLHSTPQSSHARTVRRIGPDGRPSGGLRNDDIGPNWSGYVVTGGSYISAQGTWTIPAVTYVAYPGASQVEVSSAWIGIGGDGEPTLIQLGTQHVATSSGATSYSLWYEILPAAETDINATQFVVSPGDTITASIQCTAACTPHTQSTWVLSMTNGNRWKTPFTIQLVYSSSLASAEWIMEAACMSNCSNPITDIAYLPNFGSTAFTAISVNNANPNLSRVQNAVMLTDPNGKALSIPSDPVGGDSFTVKYVRPGSP